MPPAVAGYYAVLAVLLFKGQVHVFAGGVKIVSHSYCRTSAILKYFCPLLYQDEMHFKMARFLIITKNML